MATTLRDTVKTTLDEIEHKGLTKTERSLSSPQGVTITVEGKEYLNFCANNYLGLSNDEDLREAVKTGMDRYGYGLSSVRFICGTQLQHRELEQKLAALVGQEDAVLYSSCFDANTGLFETLLSADDAIISDKLNHASIIDGIRLCKADRNVYEHSDMADLTRVLTETQNKRVRLIATDGVFSMDGEVAKLSQICDLAEKYNASVMVDDSHGTGVIGAHGRGSLEVENALDRVDIVTSTLGKALGGASGGFTAASKEIIELLRQRSRPYLFSNSLPSVIVSGALHVLSHADEYAERRKQLWSNAKTFRTEMTKAGFTISAGDHPIVPVMLGNAAVAKDMAERLLALEIYVIGFWYPVVPEGKARIRVQLSAAHTPEQVRQLIAAFVSVGKELKVIS